MSYSHNPETGKFAPITRKGTYRKLQELVQQDVKSGKYPSQAAVAASLGISGQHLSDVIHHREKPSKRLKEKICERYSPRAIEIFPEENHINSA